MQSLASSSEEDSLRARKLTPSQSEMPARANTVTEGEAGGDATNNNNTLTNYTTIPTIIEEGDSQTSTKGVGVECADREKGKEKVTNDAPPSFQLGQQQDTQDEIGKEKEKEGEAMMVVGSPPPQHRPLPPTAKKPTLRPKEFFIRENEITGKGKEKEKEDGGGGGIDNSQQRPKRGLSFITNTDEWLRKRLEKTKRKGVGAGGDIYSGRGGRKPESAGNSLRRGKIFTNYRDVSLFSN